MNISGRNYIGKNISSKGDLSFRAIDPSNVSVLPEKFYEATAQEIGEAAGLAGAAFKTYSDIPVEKKAEFLIAIAENLEKQTTSIIKRAGLETALPEQRLKGELGRTSNQLKMFAELLREGSWINARIDTAISDRTPVPKPDIRRMMIPIGPVAVFAASNFPLAFSVAGGDTASALAAGNPVIVKAHPSHPGTSELVARIVLQAADDCGMPDGIFSLLQGNTYGTGKSLVRQPLIQAVSFTGSTQGGMALFDAANSRLQPIPFFAEMGSVNPVFILPGIMKSKSGHVAEQLAASITLGVGQFCTKPGLIFIVTTGTHNAFELELAEKLQNTSRGNMLNQRITEGYNTKMRQKLTTDYVKPVFSPSYKDIQPTTGVTALAVVDSDHFIKNRQLHEEVFGPFALIVRCKSIDEMIEAAGLLDGQLTVSLMGKEEELATNKAFVQSLKQIAGRIIFNDVPTGVEVCPSMQHGGPFPSTSDSRFTSVGTAAIYRFVRPVSYQNCPQELLPSALQNRNPDGIWRMINGQWTKDGI